MSSDNLAMLRVGVCEDVLDEIVAVLIAGNVDQRDPGPIGSALTDAIQVSAEKLRPADLEALLNDLGGELVHAVLGGVAEDVVYGPATIARGAMLTDVLDAPVAKLAVGNNVDVGEDLFDTRALQVKRVLDK